MGATFELVGAYEPVPAWCLRKSDATYPEDLQWAINPCEDIGATLEVAAQVARKAGIPLDAYPRQGDPANAILDVAEEREADLIVVGNKGTTSPNGSCSGRCRAMSPNTRPAWC